MHRQRVTRVVVRALSVPLALLAVLSQAVPGAAAPSPAVTVPADAPAPTPAAGRGAPIPGRYVVEFRPGTPGVAGLADSLTRAAGGNVHFVYEHVLQGFAATLPDAAVPGLRRNPNVLRIEPDTVVTANDTQTGATWGLDRVDQRNLPLDGSYTDHNEGTGVHAYIVDTGIRSTHAEFTGRLGAGYTAIGDGRGTSDCNGHGTHVAGTVGGTVYGVADKVTLHAVRVLDCSGSGTNSGVIAGLNWVAANAVKPAVANMSLGGGASSTLDTAVGNLVTGGVTVAVAAGNDNLNACNYSPARVPAAITVGATTSTDARSSFSNTGSCLDLFAPGTSITSAWSTGDTATNTISGTSMATPHVAGVAALVLSAAPLATPAEVRNTIVANATPSKVTGAGTGSPNLLLFNAAGAAPTTSTTAATTTTSSPTSTTAAPTTTTAPAPAPANVLRNPGFESGRVSWTESSRLGFVLVDTTWPRSGSWSAWLGGANNETSVLSQSSVVVPAGGRLSYWWYVQSQEAPGSDNLAVRITTSAGTTTLRTHSTGTRNTWTQTTVDLSAYAGRTVTLTFRATTNSTSPSSFFVDDVALGA